MNTFAYNYAHACSAIHTLSNMENSYNYIATVASYYIHVAADIFIVEGVIGVDRRYRICDLLCENRPCSHLV